jgi:TfuA protein
VRIKIYAGLSLDEATARTHFPDCDFAGPAARGDVLADARAGTNVVALVDGRFQESLAVSIGEIADALRAGVRVYGSSSMGALRAVELRDEGMIGCGEIVRWILAQPTFRDDELGQLWSEGAPARSASVPFANLYFGLRALTAAGELDDAAAEHLAAIYRGLFFADRHALGYERALAAAGVAPPLVALARRALAHDQKRLDALELLARIEADVAEVARKNAALMQSFRAARAFDAFDPDKQLHVRVLLGS